ncbi:MAG TPA: A24 family peptidase [archaeon]|nr:A24 family peptidase [archaeon]
MITLIQQGILLIGTLSGAITDIKTGYIYDWITYPMIIIGLILSIMQGQMTNLLIAGIIFVILLIGYKFGKIGGGDVKLFTAISLLNPFNNIEFIITLIFTASLLSMTFYSTNYIIKYLKKGIELKKEKEGIKKAIFFSLILVGYLAILLNFGMIKIEIAIILGIPFLLGLIFIALQNGIKENFFEKKIKLKDAEEDEILSKNNPQKILDIVNGKELIEEKEIALLKKHNIKEIIVLRNLPKFGPFIFLGTIIALNYPTLIITLLF